MSNALKTILVIDDSAAVQRLVRSLLEDDFPNIHAAGDGTSGLQMAATIQPDVILLDLDLPDMNGFDVCRFMKANPATAAIPLIFLSASNSIDAKVCGLDLLAADYITKPFNPQELCARVRSVMRGHRTPASSTTSPEQIPASGDQKGYMEFA